MKLLDLILIAIILILVVLERLSKQKHDITSEPESLPASEMKYPYRSKMLLTKSEYAFYRILKEKCDTNSLLICPKVRMEDFLQVTDNKNTLKYRGYIRSRHIDFMLCDNKLHLLAGIELDDNTHSKPDVQQKDNFKNEVFKTINLPLYRIKVNSNTSYEEQIETILIELLHKNKEPSAQ